MHMTLNIGTAIGRTSEHLTATHIIQTLERIGLAVRRLAVVPSPCSDESTVAVDVEGHPHLTASVARLLGQECVAVWLPKAARGYLIGPMADAWGPFNPAFFVHADGSPMQDSQPVPLAA